MSENTMTKSQAKRKARQEANKKAQKEAKRTNLTSNLIIALVVAIFVAGIGSYVYYRATTTQASSDYSAYLNEDGTLKDINVEASITPFDYKNITVSAADVTYTEEEMNQAIESLLTTYEAEEFTDEFVAEHLSDVAATADEYKEYLKTTNEASKLESAILAFINENAKATSIDDNYLKYLKGIIKYDHETYYNAYNQTMMMYTGAPIYKNFSEYTGMNNKEFEAYLDEQSKARAAIDMTYQYIFTDAGLTIDDDDYKATTAALGSTAFDTYGKRYLMQMTMHDVVVSYLMENVNIQSEAN